MRVELVKEFSFEAAHKLPLAPSGHKSTYLHGHNFRVAVMVESEVDLHTHSGRLTGYDEIQQAMQPLLDQYLDHARLDEVEGLENPTSENISRWIWNRLRDRLPGLKRVSLHETCSPDCHYEES